MAVPNTSDPWWGYAADSVLLQQSTVTASGFWARALGGVTVVVGFYTSFWRVAIIFNICNLGLVISFWYVLAMIQWCSKCQSPKKTIVRCCEEMRTTFTSSNPVFRRMCLQLCQNSHKLVILAALLRWKERLSLYESAFWSSHVSSRWLWHKLFAHEKVAIWKFFFFAVEKTQLSTGKTW